MHRDREIVADVLQPAQSERADRRRWTLRGHMAGGGAGGLLDRRMAGDAATASGTIEPRLPFSDLSVYPATCCVAVRRFERAITVRWPSAAPAMRRRLRNAS